MSYNTVEGRPYVMSRDVSIWCPPILLFLCFYPMLVTLHHISSISCSNIVSLYDDHEKKHIWTPTKKVRGRPYMRSGDVPAEGPPEFFLCPGLASIFSLVRALSVGHSYRFLKMLTILENVTILYSCDKVDKILKLGKILKFRRNSEM